MTEEAKSEPTLNFNAKHYKIDELSDNQKYLVAQIQDLDSQMKQIEARLHQAQMAKKGFTDALEGTLDGMEQVPPPAEEVFDGSLAEETAT
tara:strand:- start:202 stop:474 length:273 start_codon:yes stop_codon:yes gene_type:complete